MESKVVLPLNSEYLARKESIGARPMKGELFCNSRDINNDLANRNSN